MTVTCRISLTAQWRNFFEDEFGIEIYQEKYRFNGPSKARRLRAFVKTEDEYTVAKVARALWQHGESLPRYQSLSPETDTLTTRFFDLISRIEGGGSA